jgi:hypothetical protein
VSPGRSRKVTTLKLRLDFTQMLTNQLSLLAIRQAFRDYLLTPTIVRFGEDVSRGLKAERHDLRTSLRDLGPTFSVRRERFNRCAQACHHDKRSK